MEEPTTYKSAPPQKRIYIRPAPNPGDVWAQIYCAAIAGGLKMKDADQALRWADSGVVEYLKRYQRSASRTLSVKDTKKEITANAAAFEIVQETSD